MFKLLAIALIATASFAAQAGWISDDRFLGMPHAQQAGIASAVADIHEMTNTNQGEVCIPSHVTVGQLRDIAVAAVREEVTLVRAWPSTHPMYAYKEFVLSMATVTIRNGLAKHFGCKFVETKGWVMVR